MARRRRTGVVRQRWDCLAAERRVSWVRTFWAVSGSRVVAIFGRGEDLVGVVPRV